MKTFKINWAINFSTEVEANSKAKAEETIRNIVGSGIGSSVDVDFKEIPGGPPMRMKGALSQNWIVEYLTQQ